MARYLTAAGPDPAPGKSHPDDQSKEDAIAALRAGLRDIPVFEHPEGPSVAMPAELADAVALHLWHWGARVVAEPDRHWVPPEHGDEHSLNAGKWVAR